MKKKELIIFDLDGTLLDTSEGIYSGLDEMTRAMGLPPVEADVKKKFVGPSLAKAYHDYLGLEGEDLERAVRIYRSYYGKEGYRMACLYPDMRELLTSLKKEGKKIAVATMKREDMAFKSLEAAGILGLFDTVVGNRDLDPESKASLVRTCLEREKVDPADAVLIGDTNIDAQGAEEAGVDFIAAGYGFGFEDKESVKAPCALFADDVSEIAAALL